MTGHPLFDEERQQYGIHELPDTDAETLRNTISFTPPIQPQDMEQAATAIAALARKHDATMALVTPPPYFHDILCHVLKQYGITPAFPLRGFTQGTDNKVMRSYIAQIVIG